MLRFVRSSLFAALLALSTMRAEEAVPVPFGGNAYLMEYEGQAYATGSAFGSGSFFPPILLARLRSS